MTNKQAENIAISLMEQRGDKEIQVHEIIFTSEKSISIKVSFVWYLNGHRYLFLVKTLMQPQKDS